MTLRAEAITFGYRRDTPVLGDLSAVFPAGAVTAIIGPNGAGKTTLLRLLLALIDPWSGRVTLDGDSVTSMTARARAARLAYAPHRPGVLGSFSARAVVTLGRHALEAKPDLIDRALSDADLTDKAEEPFGHLSAGQQQRAGLARAMAQLNVWSPSSHARALLADEPVASLDPAHAVTAARLLRAAAARNIAVVVATHDLAWARRGADRALALSPAGAAAAEGPAAETLDAATLERVFGVGFIHASTPEGPIPLPAFESPQRG